MVGDQKLYHQIKYWCNYYYIVASAKKQKEKKNVKSNY